MFKMLKRLIYLSLVIGFFAFCLHTYKVRTANNNDKLEQQCRNLKITNEELVSISCYLIKITPSSVKNEIFFNSLKEKFPKIENHKEIMKLLEPLKAKSAKKGEAKKSPTVAQAQ